MSRLPSFPLEPHRRRACLHAELLEQVLHGFLHRAAADAEDRSDLAVAFAFADPVQDLAFAPGEPRGWRRRGGVRLLLEQEDRGGGAALGTPNDQTRAIATKLGRRSHRA